MLGALKSSIRPTMADFGESSQIDLRVLFDLAITLARLHTWENLGEVGEPSRLHVKSRPETPPQQLLHCMMALRCNIGIDGECKKRQIGQ